MPFVAGRRVCPGEVVARVQVFKVLTTLLQKYTFLTPDGEEAPDPDPRHDTNGIILQPEQYRVKAVARQ